MKVSIVKYNAGNIFSVINSIKRLGIEPLWTDDPQDIATSDRVIFPGQGHARTAMDYLREHNLDKVIADLKQPVLGICIGQQLLCQHSEEGDTDCIGIFPINVRRFQPTCHEQKVPAMGWNAIHDLKSPLFKGLNENDYVYFVHSYKAHCEDKNIAAYVEYGGRVPALVYDGKYVYGAQFHPEKSGETGLKILRSFGSLIN